MAGQDINVLQAALTKMDWLESRQKHLAENISNADTPGYQAKDLKPLDFKKMLENTTSKMSLSRATMQTTNANHLTSSGGSKASAAARTEKSKDTYEVSPSGNNVILEEQLLKMNQTAADHQLISNLYQKQVDMLEEAITGR